MSYGMRLLNDFGEVILNSDESSFYLQTVQILTVTGTPITYGGTTYYQYNSLVVPNSKLIMVDVPFGGIIVRGLQTGHLLSWSPATFRLLDFSTSLTAAGYGAAIWNSSGQLEWVSGNEVVSAEGVGTVNSNPLVGPTTFATTSDKIALLTVLPMIVPTGGGINLAFIQGVQRASDGSGYAWAAVSTGRGPPVIIPPSPMQFLYGT